MSAPNTFGTFLHTLGSINSSSSSPIDQNIAELMKELAKSGDHVSVDQIAREFPAPRKEFVAAVLASQKRGLISFTEENGESIAHLTSLGKALVP